MKKGLNYFTFRDINVELDSMKNLLKEIVQKITTNLLGKSTDTSPADRRVRPSPPVYKKTFKLLPSFHIQFPSRVQCLFDLHYVIIMNLWINMKNY